MIETFLTEFGPAGFPLKEVCEYAVNGCGHTNPKVREANIKMITSIYRFTGDQIRDFLSEVKGSTMNIINEEFNKASIVKPDEPVVSKRIIRNEDEAPAASLNMLDDMPRVDVSKELNNSKLLAKLTDKNWKVKKEGYDKIANILQGSNNHIQNTGLHDLMGAIKQGINDKNKNVLKTALSTVVKLAKALGPGAKSYNKLIMTGVLQCLADKGTLVRTVNMEAIEAWKDAVGAENIINLCGKTIKPDNPEIRTVLLQWLIDNSQSIENSECALLVKPLIACLQDKIPQIRSLTEDVIVAVMNVKGLNVFKEGTQDLKPAVKNTILPILDKCKDQTSELQEVEEVHKAPKKKPVKVEEDMDVDEPNQMSSTMRKKEDDKQKKKMGGSLKPKPKKPAPPTKKAKKVEETGLTINNDGKKEKRNTVDS